MQLTGATASNRSNIILLIGAIAFTVTEATTYTITGATTYN